MIEQDSAPAAHFVPREKIAEARKALDKLARKAKRYGNPDVGYSIGPAMVKEFTVKNWDGSFSKVDVPGYEVTVTGEAPRVGPFEFLARVDPLGRDAKGDILPNVLMVVPGREGEVHARFRDSGGACDHCGKWRARLACYVVRNTETGEQLQVGGDCLRDYMGTDSPARIAQRFGFWEEVGRGGWVPEAERFSQGCLQLLAMAATCVRLFGWCSKAQAQDDPRLTPTVGYVRLALRGGEAGLKDGSEELILYRQIIRAVTDADWTHAAEVLDWARTLTSMEEYLTNLRVILSADAVSNSRHMGLAVSAINAHAKAVERELRRTAERRALAASKWVGSEGERLRKLHVRLLSQRNVGSNNWADCILIKFQDPATGAVFSWFTSKGSKLQVGEECVITGTVKEHREYQGVQETALSRVKLEAN